MEDQTEQEAIFSIYLNKKKVTDPCDALRLTIPINDFNNILIQCFQNIDNSSIQEQIKEDVEKSITNIKFLFQTAYYKYDKSDISTIIHTLFVIYLKTSNSELKHDILDLIEYMIHQDQNIFLFIINNTDFIQDFILRSKKDQSYEESIQFIHLISIIPFTENDEIVKFYKENKLIEFICLEFQKLSSIIDNQDPEFLSTMTYLMNKIFNLYSRIQLLSTEEAHLILQTFYLIIENKNEFYFFDLFVDDIISSLIQSIGIINSSLLIENGLYNQLLSNLYSIDCYQNDKKLIFIFFTKFFDIYSSTELIDSLNFEILCKPLMNLHSSDLYPFLFYFIKSLLLRKPDFIELLTQISFFNHFLEQIKSLSYKSQVSFWSLILTIISSATFEHLTEILNDQNLTNNLFDFLKIVDKDFIISHIDYLVESSTDSFQNFQYYQSCLYDFVVGFYDSEPEIFDKFQDFILIKD